MPRYGIPPNVQKAFDDAERFATMVKIELDASQGGTLRWTTIPVMEPVEFNGEMWEPNNPFITTDDSRSFPGEEGTITVKILDPKQEWFHKIRRSKTRGIVVDIHWVIGLDEEPYIYQYGMFPGRSQSVSTNPSKQGIQETRLVVEDKMYFTRRDIGESTADSYQRSLTPPGQPEDDSHQVAHKARKFNLLGL